MKRIFFHISTSLFLLIAFHGKALGGTSPSVTDYTNYPIFISKAVTPNVLIILDNSTSMQAEAYQADFIYNSAKSYYGYFDPSKWYKYDGDKFVEDPSESAPFRVKGNVMNWACMRRIDVARKVLVGGKALSRAGTGKKVLLGDPVGDWGPWKHNGTYADWNTREDVVGPGDGPEWFSLNGHGELLVAYWDEPYPGAGWETWIYVDYNIKVEVEHEQTIGLVQNTESKVRYGLEFFNSRQGGRVSQKISDNNGANLLSDIQNTSPTIWPNITYTPLAESLYEGARYFAQITPYYPNSALGPSFSVDNAWDPYYFEGGVGSVPCAKSFVIIITDGDSTYDWDVPAPLKDTDNDSDSTGFVNYESESSDFLDDVALWAHTTDLRSSSFGKPLDGEQTLTIYTVSAFGGSTSSLLMDAAKNGGFIDKDGDNMPDPLGVEWDKDNDGIPDTYYEAEDGFALASALTNAINDILKRATSGTAVSVLSTSSRGEGAVYQAYFLPSKPEGLSEVNWIGYLQCLWVDQYSNLREDTATKLSLTLKEDKIIQFEFDSAANQTKIKRYVDLDGDGEKDPGQTPETITLEEVVPVWEAGDILANTSPAARNIFTFIDIDKSMKPIAGEDVFDSSDEVIAFSAANDTELRPYLGAATDAEAANIINYIRGQDQAGFRSRTITTGGSQKVWKLGDIVYSTPTIAGVPQDKYHMLYGDSSYLQYAKQYKNRESVVYVGANDGMLHAFSGGTFSASDNVNTGAVREHGWFSKVNGTPLGTELWAYVPYAALPHLKWLTQEGYTHVSYVDLRPKIADMKIFADDAVHPGGWGTVLIGGMRFGGGKISLTDDFGAGSETRVFRSEYFMLDITDPRNPELIMRFEAPELGFSLSYPSVAKVGDTWYVIFGSGPENSYPPDYNATSSQRARLYVVNMTTKVVYYNTLGENNAYLGSPIVVDKDFSASQSPDDTYNSEVGYIGEAYYASNRWKGALYRFMMKEDKIPTNWLINPIMITGIDNVVINPPAITTDSSNNMWLYFGTGKMLSEADKADTDREYFIGVKEPCTDFSSTSSCNDSIDINNLFDTSNAVVSMGGTSVTGVGGSITDWSSLVASTISDPTYLGWKLNLPVGGEKILSKPTIIGGLVLFTSYIPSSDICSFGGSGYMYSIYYETGTAYKKPTIGLEVDGITVKRRVSLGQGVPSSIGMHVGRNDAGKSFVQTSTGTIVEISTTTPFTPKSGLTFWTFR